MSRAAPLAIVFLRAHPSRLRRPAAEVARDESRTTARNRTTALNPRTSIPSTIPELKTARKLVRKNPGILPNKSDLPTPTAQPASSVTSSFLTHRQPLFFLTFRKVLNEVGRALGRTRPAQTPCPLIWIVLKHVPRLRMDGLRMLTINHPLPLTR